MEHPEPRRLHWIHEDGRTRIEAFWPVIAIGASALARTTEIRERYLSLHMEKDGGVESRYLVIKDDFGQTCRYRPLPSESTDIALWMAERG